jgi:hypothetical protein
MRARRTSTMAVSQRPTAPTCAPKQQRKMYTGSARRESHPQSPLIQSDITTTDLLDLPTPDQPTNLTDYLLSYIHAPYLPFTCLHICLTLAYIPPCYLPPLIYKNNCLPTCFARWFVYYVNRSYYVHTFAFPPRNMDLVPVASICCFACQRVAFTVGLPMSMCVHSISPSHTSVLTCRPPLIEYYQEH